MPSSSTSAMPPPPPFPPLSAKNTSSFAYPSLKDRLPQIIVQTVDRLHRRLNDLNQEQQEDVKGINHRLGQLRYELVRSYALTEICDGDDDQNVWNEMLRRESTENEAGVTKPPRWFETRWLYAECFAYRKMREAFQLSSLFKQEDFFSDQKRESLESAKSYILDLAEELSKLDAKKGFKKDFGFFLRCALWANKCDMSITGGDKVELSEYCLDRLVSSREAKILRDDGEKAFEVLNGDSPGDSPVGRVVDVVMDNAGLEAAADLALALLLIETKMASKVRFRVKKHPWFVSDVTKADFKFTLDYLRDLKSDDDVEEAGKLPLVDTFQRKVRDLLEKGTFEVWADDFWTYPHDYSQMQKHDSALYSDLSRGDLVIFKGDLNYRKLLGDLNWPHSRDFKESLRGFAPTNILAIRTMKSDLASGLPEGKSSEMSASGEADWMTSGEYGLIQFAGK